MGRDGVMRYTPHPPSGHPLPQGERGTYWFGHILMMTAILIIFSCWKMAAADNLSQKNNQLKGVNSKITVLKKNLQDTQKQRTELIQELKDTDKKVSNITAELYQVEGDIHKNQQMLFSLKQQLSDLEKSLSSQKDLLAAQLRASYQLGKYDYLKVLLNQQNPGTVTRLLTYYRYIHLARLKTLNEIQETRNEIQQNQMLFAAKVQELHQLYEHDQKKKAELLEMRLQRQKIVKQLNQKIQSQAARLKEYEADKKQLESLVLKLKKTSLASTSYSGSGQAFIPDQPFSRMPHRLIWPAKGRILNRSRYNGVVILAPEGQPVVSVYPGKVVFSDWLKGFGLLVIIDHGQGYMTLYANNQTLYRKQGDKVKAGDLIANIGHTGILKESGLYFEIRQNGQPLQPLQWLQAPVRR